MKTEVIITFKVPAQAFEIFKKMAKQNKAVEFWVNKGGEVSFTADLLDFYDISNDGGWEAINRQLEGVE